MTFESYRVWSLDSKSQTERKRFISGNCQSQINFYYHFHCKHYTEWSKVFLNSLQIDLLNEVPSLTVKCQVGRHTVESRSVTNVTSTCFAGCIPNSYRFSNIQFFFKLENKYYKDEFTLKRDTVTTEYCDLKKLNLINIGKSLIFLSLL